eukprot:scaffold12778_cov48-Phaeocystis_antarctica.AAC.1
MLSADEAAAKAAWFAKQGPAAAKASHMAKQDQPAAAPAAPAASAPAAPGAAAPSWGTGMISMAGMCNGTSGATPNPDPDSPLILPCARRHRVRMRRALERGCCEARVARGAGRGLARLERRRGARRGGSGGRGGARGRGSARAGTAVDGLSVQRARHAHARAGARA